MLVLTVLFRDGDFCVNGNDDDGGRGCDSVVHALNGEK